MSHFIDHPRAPYSLLVIRQPTGEAPGRFGSANCRGLLSARLGRACRLPCAFTAPHQHAIPLPQAAPPTAVPAAAPVAAPHLLPTANRRDGPHRAERLLCRQPALRAGHPVLHIPGRRGGRAAAHSPRRAQAAAGAGVSPTAAAAACEAAPSWRRQPPAHAVAAEPAHFSPACRCPPPSALPRLPPPLRRRLAPLPRCARCHPLHRPPMPAPLQPPPPSQLCRLSQLNWLPSPPPPQTRQLTT